MGHPDGPMIREAMLEGIYYPADAHTLRESLNALLKLAPSADISPQILLCPHGSIEFMGAVSAAAYKTAAALKPRRIIIIAACLQERSSRIFLPESTSFRTPLGDSIVDTAAVQTVLDVSMIFETNDLPHLREHAIEVQLPFIQHLFPETPILPILTGQSSESVLRALMSALAMLAAENENEDSKDLVVLSANLSTVASREISERQAKLALRSIESENASLLMEAASKGQFSPDEAVVIGLLAQFNIGKKARLLARSSSLSIHYDPAEATEYAAFAL